jgi:hypothetical protein
MGLINDLWGGGVPGLGFGVDFIFRHLGLTLCHLVSVEILGSFLVSWKKLTSSYFMSEFTWFSGYGIV